MLGPLLFLIMIGDIDESVLTAFLSSFADDTRVGHSIKCMEDLQNFQKDLNSIYTWATTNNMEFNSGKFECIRYGNNKFPGIKQMNDQGNPIEIKEHVKDLGGSHETRWYIRIPYKECCRGIQKNVQLGAEDL